MVICTVLGSCGDFLVFAMADFSIKVKLTKQNDLTRKLPQNVTTTVKI